MMGCLLLFDDLQATQVLTQALGDNDGAVGSLILLHQSGENTAGSQTGAVQSVQKFRLAGCLTAEADVATAGLIVTGVGHGGIRISMS